MILTRFCSQAEFDKFMSGQTLHNDKVHAAYGFKTKSVGFCFSAEKPKEAWQYLKGIVDFDVCMVIDIPRLQLRESIGKYRDARYPGLVTINKREYTTREYSNKSAILVEVLKPEEFATPEELEAVAYIKSRLEELSSIYNKPIIIHC